MTPPAHTLMSYQGPRDDMPRPATRVVAFLLASLLVHAVALLPFAHLQRGGPGLGPPSQPLIVQILAVASSPIAATSTSPTMARNSHSRQRTPRDTARNVDAPTAIATTPEAQHSVIDESDPHYIVTRRSRAFSSYSAEPDAVKPQQQHAPLASIVEEGLARSVWSMANSVNFKEEGSCALRTPPIGQQTLLQYTCTNAELELAIANVPPAALASVSTWLRAGFVTAIELHFAEGRATYVTR